MDLDYFSSLPESKQRIAGKLALQEYYRDSLYKTAKYLLNYQDVNWYTHGNIIRALEANTKRKLIVCPRGAFKSTVCTISYCIWRLIKNPNERILIDSEIYTNSKTFLREIKAHFESERLVSLFGQFNTMGNWSDGSITITRAITNKESSITCGGIETVRTGQHYTIIIGDDLNSDKNSLTQEARLKIIQHYKFYTSLLEPTGTIVIVGTRYAINDVIGHIMENEIGGE